jgi:hypothetical protein
MKLLIVITLFFSSVVTWATDLDQLSRSLFDVYKFNMKGLELNHDFLLKSCETYPYYRSIDTPTKGSHVLADHLQLALATVHQCRSLQDFTSMVNESLDKLIKIIESPEKKTLMCNYGVTNSFFAVASDPDVIDQQHNLPAHPSVIFDTNRMAGNFNVHMNERDIENTVRFYGGLLTREEIIPGMPHPFRKSITNPMSLLFHEMLHWTGHSHYPKENLDVVYLTQLCCFHHEEINELKRNRTCEILSDPQAWQENREKRIQYIEDHNLQNEVKSLIRDYHTKIH